jgi:hypothetical protein
VNAFEERLLEDEEFSRQTAELEDDILEDYAAGSLSPAEQESLRPWIMASPWRREQVQVTRLLLQNSRRKLQTRMSAWLWLTAAACIISAAVLFVRHRVPSAVPTASSKPGEVSPLPVSPKANVILGQRHIIGCRAVAWIGYGERIHVCGSPQRSHTHPGIIAWRRKWNALFGPAALYRR